MKLPGMRIKTQLTLGFAFIMIFVTLLSLVAWIQTRTMMEQTQTLYEHPYQVRQAIGMLKADVLLMRLGMTNCVLTENEASRIVIIGNIDVSRAEALDQLDILYAQYLGPRSDVDQVRQALLEWDSIREETLRLMHQGDMANAVLRTEPGGIGDTQVNKILDAITVVDTFAIGKADSLFLTSQKLFKDLNVRLLVLVGVILFLTLMINYLLGRNIRKPLDELTKVTQEYRDGNLGVRSTYARKNEFGVLSGAFNLLAETMQTDLESKEKSAALAGLMLNLNDAEKFFPATLQTLAEHSQSQMAAVYLLSADQNTFNYFASIGLDEKGKASFDAQGLEGEFGAALASKKIHHIANIPADTRFTFNTVSGKFIPREIMTIPIVSDQLTVAVISLATIRSYGEKDLEYVKQIWSTLNARVVGILAFMQIQALARKLEQQNSELNSQKRELSAQTIELNQQNVELETQKKQLGEANRLKTSFISNMSHELRTPLNSVIALAGVLSRRLTHKIPDEEFSYLEIIERNGKQLLTLINDILDLSRIEAGREEIEYSNFNLNSLLAEVVSTLNPIAQQKSIELVFEPEDGLPLLTSDLAKCRHIMLNLIGNAVKFIETGKVEVTALHKGTNVEIAVRDTGIGISEDQLPLIFDEFKQADSSASRKYGGTGLGLAIARKYAHLIGGNITVTSKLGVGSVFTFIVPVKGKAGSAANVNQTDFGKPGAKKTPTPKTLVENKRKTILLVDDSEAAVIQLKDILEEHAYQFMIARNGSEALEVMDNMMPDAIILDLMMPGVDGFQVLKTVREAEKSATLPVLILTAKHISKDELSFLKRNNIHQLIQKGEIKRSELLDAVAEMVTLNPRLKKIPKTIEDSIEGKPVILIVEDNPDNMTTVKALLADKFSVIEAVNGKTGIEQAKKHVPHLILMDIALPDIDGIQAFKAIRSEPRLQHIPVIALTASAMTNERETILQYGFDGYIVKPIEHVEFLHTVQQVLYGKE
jgi:signal transduction histidine kinase/CheY-like chemotaxis protein/HAMP domain-containing protein